MPKSNNLDEKVESYETKKSLEEELFWVDFDIKALDTYYRFGATPIFGGLMGAIPGSLFGLLSGTIAYAATGDSSYIGYSSWAGCSIGAIVGMITFPIWRGYSMKKALKKRWCIECKMSKD
jgi:hypothetical protein